MLDLTYLYGGRESGSTPHRYGAALKAPESVPPAQRYAVAVHAGSRRPVVVWNLTRACNLECEHCYAASGPRPSPGELTGAEARALLDDLAAFRVPALLLSGGEPLLRPDFMELAEYAAKLGLRLALSTNGVLLTRELVGRLKGLGFSYVGVSLDGLREAHDRFRRRAGAFEEALRGIRFCLEAGQKVGLRLTLTPATVGSLEGIFELIQREGVPRVCFYHLAPSGRGAGLTRLSNAETRQAMARILRGARELAAGAGPCEVLTVDQPCDGPFLTLELRREGRLEAARRAAELLRWNGGALNGSGVGLGCVDEQGFVHPDQFWTDVSLGNVRERPFSEIWSDPDDPWLAGLRSRQGRIRGRCAACAHFSLCGGGLRSRAAHLTGDPWASDPACYLTDEETREAGPG